MINAQQVTEKRPDHVILAGAFPVQANKPMLDLWGHTTFLTRATVVLFLLLCLDLNDLDTLVCATRWAHVVRETRFVTLWTGYQLGRLQG